MFVGAAWEKLFNNPDYNPTAYFEKTGCLLTLDGSNDHLVRIEGLPEYRPTFVYPADDDLAEESMELEESFPERSPEIGCSDLSSEDDEDLTVSTNEDPAASDSCPFFLHM
jgi:hypothetical protein